MSQPLQKLLLALCAMTSLSLLASTEASAQVGEEEHDVKRLDRATLMCTGLILTGLEVSYGVRRGYGLNFPIVGLTASYQVPTNWMLELGLFYVADVDLIRPTVHLRGGYALQLHGSSTESKRRGWRGFLTPLAGYRYAERPFYYGDGQSYIYTTHNAQLGASYDIEWGRALAALARVTLTHDFPLWTTIEEKNPFKSEKFRGSTGLHLYFGFSYAGLFVR